MVFKWRIYVWARRLYAGTIIADRSYIQWLVENRNCDAKAEGGPIRPKVPAGYTVRKEESLEAFARRLEAKYESVVVDHLRRL